MSQSSTESRHLAFLFGPPYARRWLPAFAAAAIADPVAGKALAPFLGPASQAIKGGGRARVPGGEHFGRTWAVIKPGFIGGGSNAYAKLTRADHRRTQIPARQIAMPIVWIEAMLANVADDLDRRDLYRAIRATADRFGRDIEADLTVVHTPLSAARTGLAAYFAKVDIAAEQVAAFWSAMDHGLVRRDLGGVRGRVDTVAVGRSLGRHLPRRLAQQYMQRQPV